MTIFHHLAVISHHCESLKESCYIFRLLIVLCCLGFGNQTLWSQGFPKDEDFTLYNVEDGLPDNNVHDIEQDDQGFLWVGTTGGLSCFDGQHFTNFYKSPDPKVSLGSNQIFTLLKRPDGKIYVGTDHGLSLLDPVTRQITTYLVEGEKELSKVSNKHECLALLTNGDLLAGSGVGITVYNADMEVQFEYVHFKKEDLGVKRMQFAITLLPLSNGNCYVYGNGMWLYHAKDRRIELIQEPLLGIEAYQWIQKAGIDGVAAFLDPNFEPYTLILADANSGKTGKTILDKFSASDIHWRTRFKVVSDSTLIMSSHSYGWVYGKFDPAMLTVKMNMEKHFPEYHANVMFQDKEGRLWFGTQYGLLGQSFTKEIFQYHSLLGIKHHFPHPPIVNGITRLGDNFYVGFENGGVWKMDLNLTKGELLFTSPFGGIWNIHHWTPDELFIGTQLQWTLTNPDRPYETLKKIGPSGSTFCQFKDRKKNIWAGFYGGVMRYNPVTEETLIWTSKDSSHFFPYNDAWSITETDSGYIWACGEGFHRWNPSSQEWDRNYKWMPGTEGQEGYAFQVMRTGGEDLIFSLNNNGLWKWNSKEERAEKISTGNHFFESIYQIYRDPRPDCYWFVLKAGIGFMNIKTGQQIFFNGGNGLPKGEVIDDFFLDPITDTMYIGMDNGVLAFARTDVQFSSKAPQVYITGIKLINSPKQFTAGMPVELAASDRDFSIEFSSPEFEYASNIRYEYRLSQQAWSDLGNNQSVRFANLNAGQYNFDVRARSPYGAIGNTTSMAITILPYYYETWWFKLLILFSLGSMIMLWFSWRLRQLRKLEAMRQSIAADLHDEVGASLTSVQILAALASNDISSADQKEVLSRLDLQAKKAGSSLREIVWNVHPKNDVLEIFIGDLTRHAGESLEDAGILYTIHSDTFGAEEKLSLATRQQMVRVFKEALSNVVRHSNATQAEISFRRENKMLNILIQDNGNSFDPATSLSGNGLGNMAYRMKLINGDFNIQSIPGVGTKVAFSCKLK